MAAHVAAGKGVRDERPDDSDDDADNDLRKQTPHGQTMPHPNGENMNGLFAEPRSPPFPSIFDCALRLPCGEPAFFVCAGDSAPQSRPPAHARVFFL